MEALSHAERPEHGKCLEELRAALDALSIESVLVTRHRLTLDRKAAGGGFRHPPAAELRILDGRCDLKVTVTDGRFRVREACYPVGDPRAAGDYIAALLVGQRRNQWPDSNLHSVIVG